jgi:NB-ARC domain
VLRLRQRLADRDALFIVDDAVSELQLRPVLEALIACTVVVTGRQQVAWLDPADHIALDTLSTAAGVTLLGNLVGAERVGDDPEGAASVVTACGGLPAAIRIAGIKLAGLQHLTLTRYAARLNHQDRLLDELTTGDLNIRDRLASSFQDISPCDLTVLGRLAADGNNDFTAAEAAELLGTSTAQAEATLERLTAAHCARARAGADIESAALEHSQVRSQDPVLRYRLPDLVRLFATERASSRSLSCRSPN